MTERGNAGDVAPGFIEAAGHTVGQSIYWFTSWWSCACPTSLTAASFYLLAH